MFPWTLAILSLRLQTYRVLIACNEQYLPFFTEQLLRSCNSRSPEFMFFLFSLLIKFWISNFLLIVSSHDLLSLFMILMRQTSSHRTGRNIKQSQAWLEVFQMECRLSTYWPLDSVMNCEPPSTLPTPRLYVDSEIKLYFLICAMRSENQVYFLDDSELVLIPLSYNMCGTFFPFNSFYQLFVILFYYRHTCIHIPDASPRT